MTPQKPDQKIDFALFAHLYTKKEAVDFLNKLSSLVNGQYNTKINFSQLVDQTISVDEKKVLSEFAKEMGIDLMNPTAFARLIEEAKEMMRRIPTLTLTLSLSPTPVLLEQISQWVENNCQEKYFLDIQIDHTLLGGAVVAVNGVFKDYSLKRKFEDKYKNKDLLKVGVQQPNRQSQEVTASQ
jgi:F0F1-type ATP synthase delta subunit